MKRVCCSMLRSVRGVAAANSLIPALQRLVVCLPPGRQAVTAALSHWALIGTSPAASAQELVVL